MDWANEKYQILLIDIVTVRSMYVFSFMNNITAIHSFLTDACFAVYAVRAKYAELPQFKVNDVDKFWRAENENCKYTRRSVPG
jgi:hypothetical protein